MSPLTTIPLPFGLRDVKVYPLTGETAGAAVDLPNARTFSFSEAEDFEELRGDDALQAVRGLGPAVDWQLEGGGLSFEAVKVICGGSIGEVGSTPTITKTFKKLGTDARPYFQVRGKAISDSGGDVHVLLYKGRATGEFSGEMADGAFWLSGMSGRALPRASDGALYDFIQHETETSLPS